MKKKIKTYEKKYQEIINIINFGKKNTDNDIIALNNKIRKHVNAISEKVYDNGI